ncbi:MAG: DUF268 domain-containing protein, partial [Planctomycetaceae bacterium]|nr:DUF268 domain-containing protein [Planctomycetaceae bacterium]
TYFEFLADFNELKKQKGSDGSFVFGKFYPIFSDKYEEGGTAKGDYFHQDLLVARRIFENKPEKHIDVGSRVDGFVAHVASFREIHVIDIRELDNKTKNIVFLQQNYMANLKEGLIESCDSLSCLHALEHFGLGRYGDPINYNGHIIGLDNLYKTLKVGGKFYLSVPCGMPQRIQFHAHRIFTIKYLLKLFENKYRIDHFSYVDFKGDLREDVTLDENGIETNFSLEHRQQYILAIFEMTKL